MSLNILRPILTVSCGRPAGESMEQWRAQGVAVSSLVLNNLGVENFGHYRCTVKNILGTNSTLLTLAGECSSCLLRARPVRCCWGFWLCLVFGECIPGSLVRFGIRVVWMRAWGAIVWEGVECSGGVWSLLSVIEGCIVSLECMLSVWGFEVFDFGVIWMFFVWLR